MNAFCVTRGGAIAISVWESRGSMMVHGLAGVVSA
jgi:hypothetical protein